MLDEIRKRFKDLEGHMTRDEQFTNGISIQGKDHQWMKDMRRLLEIAEQANFIMQCNIIKDVCMNDCEIGFCMEYRKLRDLFDLK